MEQLGCGLWDIRYVEEKTRGKTFTLPRWWQLKIFLECSPRTLGKIFTHFDEHYFSIGWFNHQPATYKVFVAVAPIDSYFTALPPLLLDPWIPRMHHCHTIHIVLPVSSIGILDSTKTRSAPKPVPLISWLVNLPPCKVPP